MGVCNGHPVGMEQGFFQTSMGLPSRPGMLGICTLNFPRNCPPLPPLPNLHFLQMAFKSLQKLTSSMQNRRCPIWRKAMPTMRHLQISFVNISFTRGDGVKNGIERRPRPLQKNWPEKLRLTRAPDVEARNVETTANILGTLAAFLRCPWSAAELPFANLGSLPLQKAGYFERIREAIERLTFNSFRSRNIPSNDGSYAQQRCRHHRGVSAGHRPTIAVSMKTPSRRRRPCPSKPSTAVIESLPSALRPKQTPAP